MTDKKNPKSSTKKPGPHARAKAKAAQVAALVAAGLPIPPELQTPQPTIAQPCPPPQPLVDLGPPPADSLASNAWAFRATVAAMYSAINDSRISERERRKEIRTLGASAAKLMPHARLFDAENMIRNHMAALNRKQSERRHAKLVPVPPRVRPQ